MSKDNAQTSIAEGNRIIAEFMGWKPVGNRFEKYMTYAATDGLHEQCHSIKKTEFNYHESWNLLMNVVEKIEKEGYEVSISSQMEYINDDREIYWHQDVSIQGDPQEVCSVTSGSKIESTYNAVIQFIQYFNSLTLETKQ